MGQMVLDLPFGNAEHVSQLMGRQPRAGEKIDDALARSAFGSQHIGIVSDGMGKRPVQRTSFRQKIWIGETAGRGSVIRSCMSAGCTL